MAWCPDISLDLDTFLGHRYSAPLYVDLTKTVTSAADGPDGEPEVEQEALPKVFIGKVLSSCCLLCLFVRPAQYELKVFFDKVLSSCCLLRLSVRPALYDPEVFIGKVLAS